MTYFHLWFVLGDFLSKYWPPHFKFPQASQQKTHLCDKKQKKKNIFKDNKTSKNKLFLQSLQNACEVLYSSIVLLWEAAVLVHRIGLMGFEALNLSEKCLKNEEGDAAFCLISLVIVTLKLLRYGLFFGRQFLGGTTLHLRKLRKHILVSVRSLRLPLCSQFLIPLENNTQNIGYFATDKDVVHIKSYSTTPNIMGFCKLERDEDSRYFKNFRS